MADQVPKHVQQERSRELASVEAELRTQYYESLIGRRLRVLVEARSETKGEGGRDKAEGKDVVAGDLRVAGTGGEALDGAVPARRSSPASMSSEVWTGTSCRYATVELAATSADEGRFLNVVAEEVRDDRIISALPAASR